MNSIKFVIEKNNLNQQKTGSKTNCGRRNSLKDDPKEVVRFIRCVRQRPVLYNYKLSPQQRKRTEVAKCWKKVAHEIQDMGLFRGQITPDECRRKWKNLRDTYHQYRLRKTKFKDCLEKWRYTKHMAFLTDIYQPKLKSEREKYFTENNKSPRLDDKIDVDQDDEDDDGYDDDHDDVTKISSRKVDLCTPIEEDFEYEETVQEIDVGSVQFCDVESVNEVADEVYGEIALYQDCEETIIEEDVLEESSGNVEKKFQTLTSNCVQSHVCEQIPERPTVPSNNDELDLFFKFLKSKMQKLPTTDVTELQIEFLNAVLRKEAFNAYAGKNSSDKIQ